MATQSQHQLVMCLRINIHDVSEICDSQKVAGHVKTLGWLEPKRSDMMAKVPPSQIKLSRGRRNTHLCILTQVDPFGDVVDGGDPLEEEAAEGR